MIRIPLLLILLCVCPVLCFGQTSNTRTAAVQAFKSQDFTKAIDLFKKAVKEQDSDAVSWYMLGNAYLKKGKNKEAIKALEKAVNLEPKNPLSHVGLAFAYMLTRDTSKAAATAKETLLLDPKNTDAHFILGQVALWNGSYDIAFERAKRVIDLDPANAQAHRLKGEALLASFAAQGGTVIKPPADRYDLLTESSVEFETYLSLVKDDATRKEMREYVDSLKAFAIYFGKKSNRAALDLDAPPEQGVTPLNILFKPRPSYTDEARRANARGTIELLVAFNSDGKVGAVIVLKSLERSLDRQAITAARGIKFTPKMKDGVPLSVARRIEYTFSIY